MGDSHGSLGIELLIAAPARVATIDMKLYSSLFPHECYGNIGKSVLTLPTLACVYYVSEARRLFAAPRGFYNPSL